MDLTLKTHTKNWEYQFPEKITQSLSASGDNVYISCAEKNYMLLIPKQED
jgi:hypothetical protein